MTSYAASGTVTALSVVTGNVVHIGSARAAVQYADFNVGVETVVPIKRVAQYMDFNVGLEPVDVRDSEQYTDFNVGLKPAPRIGAEYADFNFYASTGQFHRGVYMDFNVDPTTPPTPHIWYVKPQYGKEGLLFNVVGMGFGTTQAQYDGHVKLGTLDCPVNKWEVTPAQTSQALRVGGYHPDDGNPEWTLIPGWGIPSFTTKATMQNRSPDYSIILHAGDIIEMYYVNRTSTTALPNEVHPVPYFDKLTLSGSQYLIQDPLTFPSLPLLVDTEGRGWLDLLDTQVGQMVYRKFIVPSSFEGVRAGNWGAALYGTSSAGRPPRIAEFSRFVVRSPDGTPKLWVTLDDGTTPGFLWKSSGGWSNIGLTVWNTTAFVNAPYLPSFIDYGATNMENEWVVVVVPDGAESGMVKVVLEGT